MKYRISFLLTLTLISCSNDENYDPLVIGSWQLIENLVDPGNGSGIFQPVISDKKITFLKNGKYTANAPTCDMGINSGDGSEGTYDPVKMILIPDNCMSTRHISYLVEGEFLILSYPCIEACRQKYERIE